MSSRPVPTLLCAAVCLAVTTQAWADIYKWVDERGVVNYGDRPPQEAKRVRQLDAAAGTLSVVPGIPKEELEGMRERDAALRLRQLELEVEELRARAAAQAAAPAAEASEPRTYWYPAYGYPAYGFGRKWDQRPDAGWTARPTHPIAKPLASGRTPRHGGSAPYPSGRPRPPSQEPLTPVKR